MAVPAYATNLTDIILEMASTTGWTLISSGGGGANSLTAPETDDFIQGSNCISRNPWTSAAIRGMLFNSSQTITSGHAFFIWAKSDVTQALDTKANGGLQVCIGSGTGDFKAYYVDGRDTAVKGGWICYAVDPTTTQSATVGSPTATTNQFGFRWSVPTSGPSKGFPYKQDCLRHGSSVNVTEGDSGTPASWAALAVHADDGSRRWGIVQQTETGAKQLGIVNWGTASTAVYSRETGGTTVFGVTSGFVSTNFTQVNFNHADTDIIWTSKTFVALDSLNRGQFLANTSENPQVVLDSCRFIGINTFDASLDTDLIGCVFDSTNSVTVRGGLVTGTRFVTPTVAADGAALIYNETANPDGEFDNTFFSKGTNDHHAIQFGTSAPTDITLRGVEVSGFSGTGNAATLNFLRTSGTTTVNLVGCIGTFTAKVTGSHTVNFVVDPVTHTVNVKNEAGANISGARVFTWPSDNTGEVPYQETVTSITQTGGTATVTHASHGLVTNQYVWIQGANEANYNGVHQVTVTGINTYTYSIDSGTASPATGTILATGVIIYGTTDGSGNISYTRSYSTDQPVQGRVREGTGGPFYKPNTYTNVIDSGSGSSVNVTLLNDE